MKILLAILRKLAPLSLVIVALPAAGAGGSGNQGPSVLGDGLDEIIGVTGPVGGVYITASVQDFNLASTFPPAGNFTGTKFALRSLTCIPDASNGLLASCTALVDPLTGASTVCGKADPKNNLVDLNAVRAKWDQGTFTLDFTATTSVVFSCKESSPRKADPFDTIGAIGKCVGLGFFKTAAMTSTLVACVRAMRADYCGDGHSLTEKGTPLGIYDFGEDGAHDACDAGGCFEASWDERGATCISHRRYEHLIRLGTMRALAETQLRVAPTAGAKTKIEAELKKPKNASAYVKAVKKTDAKKSVVSPPPPVPPLKLGTDQLHNCETQYWPISTCLAQYTDFYYDDTHKLPGAGAWDPVDAVTAQYVCRAGATRKTSTSRIVTRTNVRWLVPPDPPEKAEVLDCCDSLHCP